MSWIMLLCYFYVQFVYQDQNTKCKWDAWDNNSTSKSQNCLFIHHCLSACIYFFEKLKVKCNFIGSVFSAYPIQVQLPLAFLDKNIRLDIGEFCTKRTTSLHQFRCFSRVSWDMCLSSDWKLASTWHVTDSWQNISNQRGSKY